MAFLQPTLETLFRQSDLLQLGVFFVIGRVAAVHFDKPKTGAVALLILGVTTTLGCWSLGIVDDPYRLADQLNPYAWLPGSQLGVSRKLSFRAVPIGARDCGVGFRMQVLL